MNLEGLRTTLSLAPENLVLMTIKMNDTATMVVATSTRNAWYPANPVHMSYFSAWTQTLRKQTYVLISPDRTRPQPDTSQFSAYLNGQNCTVESVTIIRDRTSGTYSPLHSCVYTVH